MNSTFPGSDPRKKEAIVCEHSSSKIKCGLGKCIKIHRAFYGRWNDYTCPNGFKKGHAVLQNTDCEVDVTKKVKGW